MLTSEDKKRFKDNYSRFVCSLKSFYWIPRDIVRREWRQRTQFKAFKLDKGFQLWTRSHVFTLRLKGKEHFVHFNIPRMAEKVEEGFKRDLKEIKLERQKLEQDFFDALHLLGNPTEKHWRLPDDNTIPPVDNIRIGKHLETDEEVQAILETPHKED